MLSLSDGNIGTVAFGNIYGSDKFMQNKNFQHVLDEAAEVLSSSLAEEFFPKAIGQLIDYITGVVAQRERIFKQLDAFFDIVIEQHLDPHCAKPENGGDD